MEFTNQVDSTDKAMAKIISISILHRHGSRGPGDSELSPWKHDSPIRSQWSEDEIENISTVGHQQCIHLGEWFSNFTNSNALGIENANVLWKCSKSGRAQESGVDFVNGFNSKRINVI